MPAARLALLPGLLAALFLASSGPVAPVEAAAAARSTHASQFDGPPDDTDLVSVRLTLEVADSSGALIPARARVIDEGGRAYPLGPDALLLSHSALGGYFYVNGSSSLLLPQGLTHVMVSHGFEYTPADLYVYLQQDTTVRVTLDRFAALPARGWYSGDLHSHSRHPTLDYLPTPAQVKEVAVAEGLSVLHVLDNDFMFTGGPDAESDSNTVIYYSYEYRNQTCGHVCLPGLRTPVGSICCLNPEPPYPMITDLYAQVHEQPGALAVLGHPHTTTNYGMLNDWPGAGLGRELPVLAALGAIDALDVASYSNHPDLDTVEWFDLLDTGLFVPPSAGTDAVLNRYIDAPPGGWRVYARETPGSALDYDTWLAAFGAGHSFITSFPLVPEFTVGERTMGEALEVAGDSLIAPVHIEAACAIGLRKLTLVADGEEIWSREFDSSPTTFTCDTTFELHARRPGWVLLRVDGPLGGNAALAGSQPVAYTNVVRVLHDGAPARAPSALLREIAAVNRFEVLATTRYTWPVAWQRDTLLARTARARQVYIAPFAHAPSPFALLFPRPEGEAVDTLAWQAAVDSDPGDVVTYTVMVADDSALTDPWFDTTADTTEFEIGLDEGRWYWWGVRARDLAGNIVYSTPPSARFLATYANAGVVGAGHGQRPGALPNPSRGAVWLHGMGRDVAIYDLAGRRIADVGHGITWSAGAPLWDGTRSGRPAPPGVYLARGAGSQRPVRIVRLR